MSKGLQQRKKQLLILCNKFDLKHWHDSLLLDLNTLVDSVIIT